MSNKHTPGKWTIQRRDDYFVIIDEEFNDIACLKDPFIKSHLSNANLIIASPDLLEAAEGLLQHINEGCIKPDMDNLRQRITAEKRLRKVIIKAKGK